MMELQDGLIIIGVMAAVALLLAVGVRWHNNRSQKIRYGNKTYKEANANAEKDDVLMSELPTGGARTVAYRGAEEVKQSSEKTQKKNKPNENNVSSTEHRPEIQHGLFDMEQQPEQQPEVKKTIKSEQKIAKKAALDEPKKYLEALQPGEKVPLLLDPSEEHNQDSIDYGLFAEKREPKDASLIKSLTGGGFFEKDKSESMHNELKPFIGAAEEVTSEQAKDSEQNAAEKADKKAEPKPSEDPIEAIVINLLTDPETNFDGMLLKRAMDEYGFKFGERAIYHYCGRHGDEKSQFYMANLLQPGCFDDQAMHELETHALCFFFELKVGNDNMKIYEAMLQVINRIRAEVGGEMHDEQRSVFTIQTSEHFRNRISDYKRRHLTH